MKMGTEPREEFAIRGSHHLSSPEGYGPRCLCGGCVIESSRLMEAVHFLSMEPYIKVRLSKSSLHSHVELKHGNCLM